MEPFASAHIRSMAIRDDDDSTRGNKYTPHVRTYVARASVIIRLRFAARVYHLSRVNSVKRRDINPCGARSWNGHKREGLRSDAPTVVIIERRARAANNNVAGIILMSCRARVVPRVPGADERKFLFLFRRQEISSRHISCERPDKNSPSRTVATAEWRPFI